MNRGTITVVVKPPKDDGQSSIESLKYLAITTIGQEGRRSCIYPRFCRKKLPTYYRSAATDRAANENIDGELKARH